LTKNKIVKIQFNYIEKPPLKSKKYQNFLTTQFTNGTFFKGVINEIQCIKNATVQGSIIEEKAEFLATFEVNNTRFLVLMHYVAS